MRVGRDGSAEMKRITFVAGKGYPSAEESRGYATIAGGTTPPFTEKAPFTATMRSE